MFGIEEDDAGIPAAEPGEQMIDASLDARRIAMAFLETRLRGLGRAPRVRPHEQYGRLYEAEGAW